MNFPGCIGRGLEIECHSSSHRFLSELSAEDLAIDLQESRRWLASQLGIDSRILCYPYGDWNPRVATAAAATGFEAAMLSEFVPASGNNFARGRLPLGG